MGNDNQYYYNENRFQWSSINNCVFEYLNYTDHTLNNLNYVEVMIYSSF